LGIFLPDWVGRRNLQFYSCLITTALYAIWAGVSETASSGGLITLFTLSQLVLGAGPNITTFLNPVELFPTRVRGSAHGISAAAGKCGAVLTAFAFGSLVERTGLRGALGLFSGIMFLIAILTLMIPETKGKTLEEIENGVLFDQENDRQVSASEVSVTPSTTDIKAIEVKVSTQAI
jgi:MFS transporter, PHS family, inorganic phosphate transporter